MAVESTRQTTASEDVEANIRTNVRALMLLHHKEVPEVCEALHISDSALSGRLTGERRFQVVEVKLLARLFGITMDLLASDPEELVRSRWNSTTAGDRPSLDVLNGGKRDSAPSQRSLGLTLGPVPVHT